MIAEKVSHTHPFNSPLSTTTRVSRCQKGEINLVLLKLETVSGSGISWAVQRFRGMLLRRSWESSTMLVCCQNRSRNSLKSALLEVKSVADNDVTRTHSEDTGQETSPILLLTILIPWHWEWTLLYTSVYCICVCNVCFMFLSVLSQGTLSQPEWEAASK